MMAAPFLVFALSLGFALGGRERSSLLAFGLAMVLSIAMFLLHATDALPISL